MFCFNGSLKWGYEVSSPVSTLCGGRLRSRGASSSLIKLFKGAEAEAKAYGDSYISTEHFMLAGLKGGATGLENIWRSHGITLEKFTTELDKVRGHQKVTDDNPEVRYNVLEKYARDLTELAEAGRLDPVIGRDEEIVGSFKSCRGGRKTILFS